MSSRDVDEMLADLAKHPGWQVLSERVAAYQEREAEVLRRVIVRGPERLDQLQLARARGFWAGQRWLLRQARHELAAYRKTREGEGSSV